MKIDFDKTMEDMKKQTDRLLGDRSRLTKLAKTAMEMVLEKKQFETIRDDAFLSLALIRDWATGRYAGISGKNLFLIGGALLYLLNPMDLIPDFIIGIGFLDDVAIFLTMIRRISEELEAYRVWKEG